MEICDEATDDPLLFFEPAYELALPFMKMPMGK
jgi:hypothetical protein